jgi:hypothetical protein
MSASTSRLNHHGPNVKPSRKKWKPGAQTTGIKDLTKFDRDTLSLSVSRSAGYIYKANRIDTKRTEISSAVCKSLVTGEYADILQIIDDSDSVYFNTTVKTIHETIVYCVSKAIGAKFGEEEFSQSMKNALTPESFLRYTTEDNYEFSSRQTPDVYFNQYGYEPKTRDLGGFTFIEITTSQNDNIVRSKSAKYAPLKKLANKYGGKLLTLRFDAYSYNFFSEVDKLYSQFTCDDLWLGVLSDLSVAVVKLYNQLSGNQFFLTSKALANESTNPILEMDVTKEDVREQIKHLPNKQFTPEQLEDVLDVKGECEGWGEDKMNEKDEEYLAKITNAIRKKVDVLDLFNSLKSTVDSRNKAEEEVHKVYDKYHMENPCTKNRKALVPIPIPNLEKIVYQDPTSEGVVDEMLSRFLIISEKHEQLGTWASILPVVSERIIKMTADDKKEFILGKRPDTSFVDEHGEVFSAEASGEISERAKEMLKDPEIRKKRLRDAYSDDKFLTCTNKRLEDSLGERVKKSKNELRLEGKLSYVKEQIVRQKAMKLMGKRMIRIPPSSVPASVRCDTVAEQVLKRHYYSTISKVDNLAEKLEALSAITKSGSGKPKGLSSRVVHPLMEKLIIDLGTYRDHSNPNLFQDYIESVTDEHPDCHQLIERLNDFLKIESRTSSLMLRFIQTMYREINLNVNRSRSSSGDFSLNPLPIKGGFFMSYPGQKVVSKGIISWIIMFLPGDVDPMFAKEYCPSYNTVDTALGKYMVSDPISVDCERISHYASIYDRHIMFSKAIHSAYTADGSNWSYYAENNDFLDLVALVASENNRATAELAERTRFVASQVNAGTKIDRVTNGLSTFKLRTDLAVLLLHRLLACTRLPPKSFDLSKVKAPSVNLSSGYSSIASQNIGLKVKVPCPLSGWKNGSNVDPRNLVTPMYFVNEIYPQVVFDKTKDSPTQGTRGVITKIIKVEASKMAAQDKFGRLYYNGLKSSFVGPDCPADMSDDDFISFVLDNGPSTNCMYDARSQVIGRKLASNSNEYNKLMSSEDLWDKPLTSYGPRKGLFTMGTNRSSTQGQATTVEGGFKEIETFCDYAEALQGLHKKAIDKIFKNDSRKQIDWKSKNNEVTLASLEVLVKECPIAKEKFAKMKKFGTKTHPNGELATRACLLITLANFIDKNLEDGTLTLDKACTYIAKNYKGPMVLQMFKKAQVNLREILIMSIENRLEINLVESLFRNICTNLTCEILTDGHNKLARVTNAFTAALLKLGKVSMVINFNKDMSTWCQNITPGQLIYYSMPFHGRSKGVYWQAMIALVRHSNKRLQLPVQIINEMMRDFPGGPESKRLREKMDRVKDDIIEPEFDDQMIENNIETLKQIFEEILKEPVEYDDHRVESIKNDLINHGLIALVNETNMGQGICHFQSSAHHVFCLALRDEVFRRVVCDQFTRKGLVPPSYEITNHVSSDDCTSTIFLRNTATIEAYVASDSTILGVGASRQAIKSYVTLSFALLFQEVDNMCRTLFGIKENLDKSVMSGPMAEFNQEWLMGTSLLACLMKYYSPAVEIMNTDSPTASISSYYSNTRSMKSRGAPGEDCLLAHFVNKMNTEEIFGTKEGGVNDPQLLVTEWLMENELPLRLIPSRSEIPYDLGIYPLIHPCLSEYVGPEYHNYKILKGNNPVMSDLIKRIYSPKFTTEELETKNKDSDLYMVNKEIIKSNIVPCTRLLSARKSFPLTKEEIMTIFDDNPDLEVRDPVTKREIMAVLGINLYSTGAETSFAFNNSCLMLLRSTASRSAKCFSVRGCNNLSFITCVRILLDTPNVNDIDTNLFYRGGTYEVAKGIEANISGKTFTLVRQLPTLRSSTLITQEDPNVMTMPTKRVLNAQFFADESEEGRSQKQVTRRTFESMKLVYPTLKDSLDETLETMSYELTNRNRRSVLKFLVALFNKNDSFSWQIVTTSQSSATLSQTFEDDYRNSQVFCGTCVPSSEFIRSGMSKQRLIDLLKMFVSSCSLMCAYSNPLTLAELTSFVKSIKIPSNVSKSGYLSEELGQLLNAHLGKDVGLRLSEHNSKMLAFYLRTIYPTFGIRSLIAMVGGFNVLWVDPQEQIKKEVIKANNLKYNYEGNGRFTYCVRTPTTNSTVSLDVAVLDLSLMKGIGHERAGDLEMKTNFFERFGIMITLLDSTISETGGIKNLHDAIKSMLKFLDRGNSNFYKNKIPRCKYSPSIESPGFCWYDISELGLLKKSRNEGSFLIKSANSTAPETSIRCPSNTLLVYDTDARTIKINCQYSKKSYYIGKAEMTEMSRCRFMPLVYKGVNYDGVETEEIDLDNHNDFIKCFNRGILPEMGGDLNDIDDLEDLSKLNKVRDSKSHLRGEVPLYVKKSLMLDSEGYRKKANKVDDWMMKLNESLPSSFNLSVEIKGNDGPSFYRDKNFLEKLLTKPPTVLVQMRVDELNNDRLLHSDFLDDGSLEDPKIEVIDEEAVEVVRPDQFKLLRYLEDKVEKVEDPREKLDRILKDPSYLETPEKYEEYERCLKETLEHLSKSTNGYVDENDLTNDDVMKKFYDQKKTRDDLKNDPSISNKTRKDLKRESNKNFRSNSNASVSNSSDLDKEWRKGAGKKPQVKGKFDSKSGKPESDCNWRKSDSTEPRSSKSEPLQKKKGGGLNDRETDLNALESKGGIKMNGYSFDRGYFMRSGQFVCMNSKGIYHGSTCNTHIFNFLYDNRIDLSEIHTMMTGIEIDPDITTINPSSTNQCAVNSMMGAIQVTRKLSVTIKDHINQQFLKNSVQYDEDTGGSWYSIGNLLMVMENMKENVIFIDCPSTWKSEALPAHNLIISINNLERPASEILIIYMRKGHFEFCLHKNNKHLSKNKHVTKIITNPFFDSATINLTDHTSDEEKDLYKRRYNSQGSFVPNKRHKLETVLSYLEDGNMRSRVQLAGLENLKYSLLHDYYFSSDPIMYPNFEMISQTVPKTSSIVTISDILFNLPSTEKEFGRLRVAVLKSLSNSTQDEHKEWSAWLSSLSIGKCPVGCPPIQPLLTPDELFRMLEDSGHNEDSVYTNTKYSKIKLTNRFSILQSDQDNYEVEIRDAPGFDGDRLYNSLVSLIGFKEEAKDLNFPDLSRCVNLTGDKNERQDLIEEFLPRLIPKIEIRNINLIKTKTLNKVKYKKRSLVVNFQKCDILSNNRDFETDEQIINSERSSRHFCSLEKTNLDLDRSMSLSQAAQRRIKFLIGRSMIKDSDDSEQVNTPSTLSEVSIQPSCSASNVTSAAQEYYRDSDPFTEVKIDKGAQGLDSVIEESGDVIISWAQYVEDNQDKSELGDEDAPAEIQESEINDDYEITKGILCEDSKSDEAVEVSIPDKKLSKIELRKDDDNAIINDSWYRLSMLENLSPGGRQLAGLMNIAYAQNFESMRLVIEEFAESINSAILIGDNGQEGLSRIQSEYEEVESDADLQHTALRLIGSMMSNNRFTAEEMADIIIRLDECLDDCIGIQENSGDSGKAVCDFLLMINEDVRNDQSEVNSVDRSKARENAMTSVREDPQAINRAFIMPVSTVVKAARIDNYEAIAPNTKYPHIKWVLDRVFPGLLFTSIRQLHYAVTYILNKITSKNCEIEDRARVFFTKSLCQLYLDTGAFIISDKSCPIRTPEPTRGEFKLEFIQSLIVASERVLGSTETLKRYHKIAKRIEDKMEEDEDLL